MKFMDLRPVEDHSPPIRNQKEIDDLARRNKELSPKEMERYAVRRTLHFGMPEAEALSRMSAFSYRDPHILIESRYPQTLSRYPAALCSDDGVATTCVGSLENRFGGTINVNFLTEVCLVE